MIRHLAIAVLALSQLSTARAEPPRVMTDIAPVHSLASIVMQNVGTPDVLLPPGASPHDFALKPSDARNVSQADLIVWIGEDFTPWLERAIGALAPDARSLQLIDVPGTFTLPYRKGPVFGAEAAHDHAHGEKHGHGHDKHGHGDEKHEGHRGHDGHDHGGGDHGRAEHDDGHDHGDRHREHASEDAGHHGHAHHGDVELHAWQDPENAKVWLDAIAALLAEMDPDNAATYRENAAAARRDLDALTADLRDRLKPLQGRGFIVMHDAYHYFEHRFGVEADAAILPGDGGQASAARMQAISEHMRGLGATCIFIEPQMPDRLARTLAEEHGVRIGTLDPIGDNLERGPDLYAGMMRGIGESLLDCMG